MQGFSNKFNYSENLLASMTAPTPQSNRPATQLIARTTQYVAETQNAPQTTQTSNPYTLAFLAERLANVKAELATLTNPQDMFLRLTETDRMVQEYIQMGVLGENDTSTDSIIYKQMISGYVQEMYSMYQESCRLQIEMDRVLRETVFGTPTSSPVPQFSSPMLTPTALSQQPNIIFTTMPTTAQASRLTGYSQINTDKKKKMFDNEAKAILMEHLQKTTYPSDDEKHEMMAKTGLSMKQVSDWFINARRRYLDPDGNIYEKYLTMYSKRPGASHCS